MPKILSFSSQVAYGHIGHSAGVFAWQRLGVDVIALPTILLSSRPGYPRMTSMPLEPARLLDMLASLEENGMLDRLDAVFTGYMPSPEHALMVADWIVARRRRQADIQVMCDPILGDTPGGLYIKQATAEVLRDRVVPLADIVKPNRFELGWLRGTEVNSLESAVEAAWELAPMVLVSSGAEPIGKLTNLLVCGKEAWVTEVARREEVPHGSGDMLAALFLGHILRGAAPAESLALSTAGIEAVVEGSIGADELRLLETQDVWAAPAPWPLEQMELFR